MFIGFPEDNVVTRLVNRITKRVSKLYFSHSMLSPYCCSRPG